MGKTWRKERLNQRREQEQQVDPAIHRTIFHGREAWCGAYRIAHCFRPDRPAEERLAKILAATRLGVFPFRRFWVEERNGQLVAKSKATRRIYPLGDEQTSEAILAANIKAAVRQDEEDEFQIANAGISAKQNDVAQHREGLAAETQTQEDTQ